MIFPNSNFKRSTSFRKLILISAIIIIVIQPLIYAEQTATKIESIHRLQLANEGFPELRTSVRLYEGARS
jgi:hypothetical protein